MTEKTGGWTLRRAVATDAAALAACIDAAYAAHAARIPDLPAVSAGLDAEIAAHQVWLAEIAGRVVGGLVLIPATNDMRLANVAVHPDLRGKGLGGELMALAERESLRQGFGEMCLTTHADMPDNVRLYEHLGWRVQGRNGNKIHMGKAL